ncbi:hypothetical protein BGX28_000943 [Mortierella sp. GBA30]|nr:hypothetical protein BGX28_000943 [Mortierella sp. GBA30]
MAPQVTDFDEFLALAAPSTPPHMPPPTSSSSYSSTSQDYDNSNDHYQHDTNDNNSTEPQSSTTLTPVQLVALSNLKLNSDMFSNRSLSIHRRILVKNFLTLLYKLNPPMDWGQMQMEMQQMEYGDDFGQDQGMLLGEDEQDGWMERTLHAAGLNDKDDVDMTAQKRENSVNSSGSTTPASSVGSQSQSSSLAASNSTPSAASDTKVPLPRPRSTELPQSLHSYLSTVFDVDWSVGLANTEDSLFTQAAAASSSSGSNSASLSGSSLSTTTGKRKSVGAASGLSNVSSAFAAESPKPSSAPSTHSRSSTVSTTSSFSSVTSVSSASSVSSAGSNYNAYGLEAGAGSATMKQGEAVGKLVTPSKDISMTGGRTHLARKSSLPSARPSAGNSTNGISNIQNASNRSEGSTHNNGLLPDNKGLPVRKLSINSHAKPMLVPGRRSSLLQTGQMPPALPSSKGGHQSNGVLLDGTTLVQQGLLPRLRMEFAPHISIPLTGITVHITLLVTNTGIVAFIITIDCLTVHNTQTNVLQTNVLPAGGATQAYSTITQ